MSPRSILSWLSLIIACGSLIAAEPPPAPLDPAAKAPVVDSSVFEPKPDADAATRAIAETMAKRAGLKLNEWQMAILLENAPAALDMANRIRKPRDRMDEPSSTFRFAK